MLIRETETRWDSLSIHLPLFVNSLGISALGLGKLTMTLIRSGEIFLSQGGCNPRLTGQLLADKARVPLDGRAPSQGGLAASDGWPPEPCREKTLMQ